MSRNQYNEEIEKLKKENEAIQEMNTQISSEYSRTMDDFDYKLKKLNDVLSLEGYLSEDEIQFYENYSSYIRKSQTDLEYVFESTKKNTYQKIEQNSSEIERLDTLMNEDVDSSNNQSEPIEKEN